MLENQTLVILVFSADRFSLNKYDNCNLIWQPTLTDYITYYSVKLLFKPINKLPIAKHFFFIGKNNFIETRLLCEKIPEIA